MMLTYSYALMLGFTVHGSTHPEGKDLTHSQIVAAILARLADLLASGDEILEAVLPPVYTEEQ